MNSFTELDVSETTYSETQRGAHLEVMAIGVIEYEDPLGAGYGIGVARIYDPNTNRFRPVAAADPEADREYEN